MLARVPGELLRGVGRVSGLGPREALARGFTPRLADCLVGVDVVVPGTGGSGRVVAWYSHQRREVMAEIRLM